ncbi:hypothetical protein D3C85_1483500 [compost metagenome]
MHWRIFGSQHRIDDRLVGGFYGAEIEGIEELVIQIVEVLTHTTQLWHGLGIRHTERQKNITRIVATWRAGSADAKRGAARQATELVGQHWRIGGDHDDDRAALTSQHIGEFVLKVPTDRHGQDL